MIAGHVTMKLTVKHMVMAEAMLAHGMQVCSANRQASQEKYASTALTMMAMVWQIAMTLDVDSIHSAEDQY